MKVTVYGTQYCGYCRAAESLLDRLGIPYQVIDVTGNAAARAALVTRAHGRRTVPVILIDGAVIGGYRELATMASTGELHRRLNPDDDEPDQQPPLRVKRTS